MHATRCASSAPLGGTGKRAAERAERAETSWTHLVRRISPTISIILDVRCGGRFAPPGAAETGRKPAETGGNPLQKLCSTTVRISLSRFWGPLQPLRSKRLAEIAGNAEIPPAGHRTGRA